MFIFVIICYYDLPSDNVQDSNIAAINDSYTSSTQSGDSVPRMKKLQRQSSFADKLVLWKGTVPILPVFCLAITIRNFVISKERHFDITFETDS